LSDSFGGNSVNTQLWSLPVWIQGSGATFTGRTQFIVAQNGPFPTENGGALHLGLSDYNPYAIPGNPSFYGSELISNQSFDPAVGTTLVISAQLKLDTPVPGGILGAMFLYPTTPNANSDNEIDFELLSNNYVNNTNQVETNVYANQPLGAGSPVSSDLPLGGDLTDWHTYMIKFSPGVSVSWYVDDVLIYTEKTTLPDAPMQLYFNMQAPPANWAAAYNSAINPTSDPNAAVSWGMDVKDVNVTLIR
jgi:hypothetical protein